jgi:hypothetical protein
VLTTCHLPCRGAPWRVARKAFESAVMHRAALDLHMEVMQEVCEAGDG